MTKRQDPSPDLRERKMRRPFNLGPSRGGSSSQRHTTYKHSTRTRARVPNSERETSRRNSLVAVALEYNRKSKKKHHKHKNCHRENKHHHESPATPSNSPWWEAIIRALACMSSSQSLEFWHAGLMHLVGSVYMYCCSTSGDTCPKQYHTNHETAFVSRRTHDIHKEKVELYRFEDMGPFDGSLQAFTAVTNYCRRLLRPRTTSIKAKGAALLPTPNQQHVFRE